MIYTIRSDDTSIEWGLSGSEKIAQNVLNLVRTRRYEVPFMRQMGINPDYIDSPLQFIRAQLMQEITELVETYEERAKVLEVNFINTDGKGNTVFEVKVEVQ